MKPPGFSDWLYSGKALLAALLAFYLALVLQLPNPYWSFATVYIVSHPLTGATRSKAMYRALGTLLGGAVAVAIVPPLAGQPLTLVAAIAAWIALSLYVSLRDNKPSAYVFLLASYTTPLIAIPSILAPAGVFDLALARSEEIVLGIVCASVVSTVLFPARVVTAFNERMAALMRDAATWASFRLDAASGAQAPKERFNLLSDIASLDALITHLGYDSTHRDQTRDARLIRFRMTMLIPLIASLSDALGTLPPEVRQASFSRPLEQLKQWLQEGSAGRPESGIALRTWLGALRAAHDTTGRADLAVVNTVDQLRDVVDLWSDCLVLMQSVRAPGSRAVPLHYQHPIPDERDRHLDNRLMLYAALSPAVAVLVSGWVWLNSGWPSASSGVVMIAVASAFFASADSPAPLVARFFLWETISVVVAGIYAFLILPQVTTFVGVALVLAPPLIFVGTFTGRPSFNTGVLLLTSQTISDLAIGNRLTSDFQSYANASLGMLLGLIFAIIWNGIVRPFGTEVAARRLAIANWQSQLKLSRDTYRANRAPTFSRVLDRTTQWLPRLALTSGQALMSMDAVRDLRVCLALIELRAQANAHGRAQDIDAVLRASADYFQRCLEARASLAPDEALLARIDQAMDDNASGLAHELFRYRLALLSGFALREPRSTSLSSQSHLSTLA